MKNITQKLFFAVVFFLSTAAFAQTSLVPTGVFKFSPQLDLVTVKKYELVNTITPQGKDRLAELKTKGWTCLQQTSNTLQCSVFAKNQTLPEDVSTLIVNKYKNLVFNFSAEYVLSLVNDTEFIREYEVKQDVDVSGKKVATYVLRESKDSPTKLQMEAGWEKIFLVRLDEKTLSIQETNIVRNQNSSTLYLVQVFFEKE